MDTHSYASFADEFQKIALFSELTKEQQEHIKRRLIDAGVAAGGFGLGYGAGSAVGRHLGWKHPGLKGLVTGAAAAGGGLLGLHLARKRQEYIDRGVDDTGATGLRPGRP